ncbi:MAG: VWA domain-containing protein [Ruminiclostridium sp.]|nr:VWA domain-containing protein [Ruminiclostridium sp.]
MKKIVSILLSVVIAALGLCGVTAGAVGATTDEVDVVFLVDSSMSMAKSDPEFIRLEAIKLFADLCSLGNTKIGFVLFGSEINYSQAPTAINTEADRDKLKNDVSGFTEMHGSTDIGKAVKYAVEMLAQDEYEGKGKLIVFLSDGKTVITGNKERTLEASQQDLDDAILAAQNAGIPIYTIGLNANGDVDEDELGRISYYTYADDTYMTDSASDLSEILSDIYVRHTGAQTAELENFVSDGEAHDVIFTIADTTVVEANLVVMHHGGVADIRLYDETGAEAPYDDKTAAISRNENYSLVKIYYPRKGDWRLSVKSDRDTKVNVNYILTMDYTLALTYSTDKAVGEGTRVRFFAVLNDLDGQPISDESVMARLSGRITVRNADTDEENEVALVLEEGVFGGEYILPTGSPYTIQASLYNNSIDIRSDIARLEPGSEDFKEPEGPLKLILICAGAALALIVIIIVTVKSIKKNHRMWSGKIVLTVTADGMPTPPAHYEFAKKIPGKRIVTLAAVMKELFAGTEAENALPHGIASAVKITMNETGDLRVLKIGQLEYNGGVTLGKNVILSNAYRVTLRYTPKSGGTSSVIIQYFRT